jgi:type II secretion system (T2SS) protein E
MATAHLNGSYGYGHETVALPLAIPPRRVAVSPPRTRLLGELLVREGLVTESHLAVALRGQEATPDGTPLGQLLVEQGAISPADLEAVLHRYHKKYRLGDILVETNVISEAQLQLGVDHHRRTGLRLGDALLQLGFLNEEMLKLALCTQLDIAFIDLDRFDIDRGLASLLPKAFAQQHRVLPVARVDGVLTVGLADPIDGWIAENVEAMTGFQVRLVISTDAAFQRAFTRVYGENPGVGLARQHERLEQAHSVLTREYENAARALAELRQSHEEFLRDQAELLRTAAEQASQQSVHERQLAELQAAHSALREEHEARGHAHAEVLRAQSETLESLTMVRSEHGRLLSEHHDLGRQLVELQAAHSTLREEHEARGHAHAEVLRTQSETLESLTMVRHEHGRLLSEHHDVGRQLVEERERGGELARRLVELEAAHIVGRRELDERLTALTALDAAYAETTQALTGLRAEHETLRGEYDRVSHELRERCHTAEARQQLAVQQLETLLTRLRQ